MNCFFEGVFQDKNRINAQVALKKATKLGTIINGGKTYSRSQPVLRAGNLNGASSGERYQSRETFLMRYETRVSLLF